MHRPAYLDYVGVKTFDANGEVVGERRFLGLFSSRRLHRVADPDPGAAGEGHRRCIDRAGFDPQSHAGKALMDVLETYPRDELFQTPIDELVPIAEAVMHTRERRQLRLFVRRDTYGRYLSCLVYLPRDRYNTERPRADRGRSSRTSWRRVRRVHRPRQRVAAGPRCTSSSGPPRASTIARGRRPATSSAGWPRRPGRGATTSSPRCIAEYGEEDGARLARTYADSFPEAYKEDFAPRTGAVDLGRLEAHRRRGRPRPVPLPADRRRPPARRG